MSGITTAPPKERSILIRVDGSVPSNSRITDYSGSDGYDYRKIFPCRYCCTDSDSDSDLKPRKNDSDPQNTKQRNNNPWFIIEHTDSDLKLSEIFHDYPVDHSGVSDSAFSLVDSSLYVIGGQSYTRMLFDFDGGCSRRIHRLDIRDPAAGWNTCNSLAAGFSYLRDNAAVFGQYIYLFSPFRNGAIGYVYDTINQDGFFLANPRDCEFEAQIWAPLEKGRGMLIADLRSTKQFYLHDPFRNRLQWCQDFEQLPNFESIHHSFLNGTLYFFQTYSFRRPIDLYAYDCYKGKLLYKVRIPKLRKGLPKGGYDEAENCCPDYIVAVTASKFCFLWKRAFTGVFCSEILVSFGDSVPSAELLRTRFFKIDGIFHITNFIAVDANLGQIAKDSTTAKRREELCVDVEEKTQDDGVKTDTKLKRKRRRNRKRKLRERE